MSQAKKREEYLNTLPEESRHLLRFLVAMAPTVRGEKDLRLIEDQVHRAIHLEVGSK